MLRLIPALALIVTLACSSRSGPPYSPQQEQKTFRLPPGFRIELVASEPQVIDPVAMTFDEAGHIYAVEMRDYPMGDDPPGRIRLLEDRDGDGVYETSSVFADNLKLPNGVMRWRKGILVTSTPDILYFEDTNGDGKADVRKVMLTGFASQNPQLRLNGPQYGMDNWIYAAYTRRATARRYAKEFGDKGQPIRFPDRPDLPPLDIHSRDVRFRPDEGKLEAMAGYSQFGWGFNEWGDRFLVWNSDHIRHEPISGATLDRNPSLAIPNPMETASDHKAQSTVYPITVNPLYTHDSQIGHFTSSCGLSVYTGANLPADFQNSSFTCEPVHNLVHRDILKPKGGTWVASRAYENSEFLASTDAWFRPVFTMTGPDGALYVVDYYRHSVEHPEFVPPELFKDLDFTSKPQKGRIWRVRHESSTTRAKPSLDRAAAQDLVALLADPNQWWRLQAQRLLVDRHDAAVVPALDKMARTSQSPLGRIHALWTLDGIGALSEDHVLGALGDADAAVRRQGARLASSRLEKPVILRKLLALAADPDTQVRYDAAQVIAGLPENEAFPALARIAQQDPADPWLQVVALSNARSNPMQWFRAATSSSAPEPTFVQRIASLIGNRGADADIAALLAQAAQPKAWSTAMMAGLAEGLNASSAMNQPHPRAQAAVVRLLAAPRGASNDSVLRAAAALRVPVEAVAAVARSAERTAADDRAPIEDRVHAVGVAGLAAGADGAPVARFLSPQFPAPLRMAAVRALTRRPPEAAAPVFLANWRAMTGDMRQAALGTILGNPKTTTQLLAAVEDGQIPVWTVGQVRLRALERHDDPAIRARAAKLSEQAGGADRVEVYKRYIAAAHNTGDAARGRQVFERVCAECHELGGVGKQVGPDLRGVVKRYKETLLAGILMPSEAIEPGYEEYVVETTDGRLITGILAEDTPSSIRLRRAKGEEDVVPRSQIREMRASGASAMPDGLEKDITVAQMTDLIAYLKAPK